jgi:hypothetical protein
MAEVAENEPRILHNLSGEEYNLAMPRIFMRSKAS